MLFQGDYVSKNTIFMPNGRNENIQVLPFAQVIGAFHSNE